MAACSQTEEDPSLLRGLQELHSEARICSLPHLLRWGRQLSRNLGFSQYQQETVRRFHQLVDLYERT